MKFISFNVNGIRACMKKGFESFFYAADADFFCVQETKLSNELRVFEPNGYFSFYAYAAKNGYSGTAIFTKHKPIDTRYSIEPSKKAYDSEGRFVILEYERFILVNVYVPNAQRGLTRLEYRMKWQDDFLAFLQSLKKPVIICGDLNVAHTEKDIKNARSNINNAGFTELERAKMTELIDTGFIDTFRYLHPDVTDAYSWWSYMAGARERNIGWRIDYFLVSSSLKEQIKDAFILPDIMGSDHCPVGLVADIYR